MKNLLKIWLIAFLLPVLVSGQKLEVIGNVDMSGYYTRQQSDSAVDAKIKAALSGVIVTPPVVVLDDCDRGPTVTNVTAITQTSLTGWFDGENVFGINWKITRSKTDTSRIRSGWFAPQGANPSISFSQLDPGSYVLWYSGSTCKGESNRAFTVPKLTGDGGGATPENPPVDLGNITPAIITQGLYTHMDLVFTGSPGDWRITDNADVDLRDNYEFRYIINSQIVLQRTPLKNYKYKSNHPIRVIKFKTKVGLTTLNKWDNVPGVPYNDREAGLEFDHNSSAAIYTGVFRNAPGTAIPAAYDPDKQTTQWADIITFKLPKGHFFVAPKGEWSIESQLKAGVTHISHFSLPWDNPERLEELRRTGVTYSDVQRPENFIPLPDTGKDSLTTGGFNARYWPTGPLTPEQGLIVAYRQFIHNLTINETDEGRSYMPAWQPMWGYVYAPWRKRQVDDFDSKGVQSYLATNYYRLGLPELTTNSTKERLFMFSRNPNIEGNYNMWTGGSLRDNNLISIGIYLIAPDIQFAIPYNSIYQSINAKAVGQNSAIFLAGVHEWKPNNLYRIKYPDGDYYQHEKIPLEPNLIVNHGFLAQIYGVGGIEWGGGGKQTTRKVTLEYKSGLWFPTGAKSPQGGFPHAATDNNYYIPYTGEVDLMAFGTKLYADTFGQVAGGETLYLRHRIDNGPWIVPFQTNADEVTEAFCEKRGLVYSQIKGDRIAWFYMNPFADNLSHKLEVILPDGRTIAETVSTTAVHAKLQ